VSGRDRVSHRSRTRAASDPKRQGCAADSDLVTVSQPGRCRDPLPVDERAIFAAEILDRRFAASDGSVGLSVGRSTSCSSLTTRSPDLAAHGANVREAQLPHASSAGAWRVRANGEYDLESPRHPRRRVKPVILASVCLFAHSIFCSSSYAQDDLPRWPEAWRLPDRYAAPWATTQMAREFPYGHAIQFEVWPSSSGVPTGVGAILRADGQCTGVMSWDAEATKLRFTPAQDDSCAGIPAGAFDFVRDFGDVAVMLTFVPDGAQSTPQLSLTHTSSFRRQADTPPSIAALAEQVRAAGADASVAGLAATTSAQAETVALMRSELAEGFNDYFSEPLLLGMWRGELVDERQTIPIEVAMWTRKDVLVYGIGGVVRLGDQYCPAVIAVDDTSTAFAFHFNSAPITSRTATCDGLTANGTVRLDTAGARIALLVDVVSDSRQLSSASCIDGLSELDGATVCRAAAILRRASSSPAFDRAMTQIDWNANVETQRLAPAGADWEVIKKNDASLASLGAAHQEALASNAQFYTALEASMIEADRQRELERQARNAQARQQAAAEAQRRARIDAEWAARSATSGLPATAPLPTLPSVSGPFDGLSGGDFLNALYDQDFGALARFDDYYRQLKLRQRRALMGNTWADGILDAAYESFELATSVLGVYLFRYQSEYARCLRDDAVTFEVVTEHPDTVYRNQIGVEVARYYGGTTVEEYTVNAEFESAFRRIGTTLPEGAMSTLADYLLNGGGTDLRRELLGGTRQMMAQFPCDSAVIERMEEGLKAFSAR
jgi:hypothetical protein